MGTPGVVEVCEMKPGYVLRVVGRGTMRESPAVREFATCSIDDGVPIVVDLNDCVFLDSTFLGCLVILKKRADPEGRSFGVHANEPIRSILFATIGLDKYLPFVEACSYQSSETTQLPITEIERVEFCRHLIESHGNLADLGGFNSKTFRAIADQMERELGEM